MFWSKRTQKDILLPTEMIREKSGKLIERFTSDYPDYDFRINENNIDSQAFYSSNERPLIYIGLGLFNKSEHDGRMPISAYVALCHDVCHELGHIEQFKYLFNGAISPPYMKETGLDIIIESHIPEYKWAIYEDCPKEQYAEWYGLKLFDKYARHDVLLKEHNIDYKSCITDWINQHNIWFTDLPVESVKDAMDKLDFCLFKKTDSTRLFNRQILYDPMKIYGSIANITDSKLNEILKFPELKSEINTYNTKDRLSDALLKGLCLLDKDFAKNISTYLPKRLSFLANEEKPRKVNDSMIQYDNPQDNEFHF